MTCGVVGPFQASLGQPVGLRKLRPTASPIHALREARTGPTTWPVQDNVVTQRAQSPTDSITVQVRTTQSADTTPRKK